LVKSYADRVGGLADTFPGIPWETKPSGGTYPDMPWEPNESFNAVARFYQGERPSDVSNP
jgi:hypothetical protein